MNKSFSPEPGETIVKRAGEISWGNSFPKGKNDLILTDRALVVQKKNLFGKDTEAVRAFPFPRSSSPTARPRFAWGRRTSSPPRWMCISTRGWRASASALRTT